MGHYIIILRDIRLNGLDTPAKNGQRDGDPLEVPI